MRGMFGLVGLLVALLVVGSLVRKQMTTSILKETPVQAIAGLPTGSASATANVAQHSQQSQQQVKQALDAAFQARPMPDDK